MRQVSAVVCTLNSISSIQNCLESLITCGVGEIIVVDGGSIDGTLEILQKYDCKIVFDEGKGLGAARNLGIINSKLKYVLNCGSDNIIPRSTLYEMMELLASDQSLGGVSCTTRVEVHGILSYFLNLQWKGRISAGIKEVIGTPSIFRRELLIENLFATHRTWSDDEELCTRLAENFALKFATVSSHCLELGQDSFKRLQYRFAAYGRSDFEVWKERSGGWSRSRKIKSIFHPFKSEVVTVMKNLTLIESLIVFPFLLFACLARYKSWFKLSVK